jgi:hypothetical protein
VVADETTTVVVGESTTVPATTVIVVADQPATVVDTTTPLVNHKQTCRQPSTLIEQTARSHGIILDDEIILRIIRNCELKDPFAIEEEIAYMLGVKINQLKGSRNIGNFPALLAKAVPSLFLSTEVQRYRSHKARERIEEREVAESVLRDSEAPEDMKTWAGRVFTG